MAKIDTSISEIRLLRGIELSEYYNRELQNNESELIVINETLYKIIETNLRKQKTEIMEFLHDNPTGLPIDIIDILYENKKFFAYTMKLYKGYEELYHFIKSNASIEERKKLALELVKIYEIMYNLKIIYFDWHSKNLMFKNDLKLLDIDSAKRSNNVYYDAVSRRNLLNLCLSVIIGIDLDFDYDRSAGEKLDILNKIIAENEELEFSKIMPLAFDNIKSEIMSYTQTKVDCKREIILK